MSVTVTKTEGMTVFTMTSKPGSKWPPLCQILGTLCYSPICSVSQGLRRPQDCSQSLLGTIQIMVGLVNIALGTILEFGKWNHMSWSGALFCSSVVFVAVGIMCILSEKFPSPCVVGINVLVNLVGVALAITAIVLYSLDLVDDKLWGICSDDYYHDYHDSPTPLPSQEKCMELKLITLGLLNALDIMLIVLAVLQLCVTISSVVLSIKALYKNQKEGEEINQDKEQYKPLLEGDNPAA